MRVFRFWLRWSLRDLRARWLQVAAIALVIALGTGAYAGLSSTTEWRRQSSLASYDALAMYDLRVELPTGAFAPQGTLLDVVGSVEHAAWVQAAEERLIVSTQVDVSTDGQAVLVPGRLYGVDVRDGGPHVNASDIRRGRALTAEDAGEPVALVEDNFAREYDLPAEGEMTLSGGERLTYVGHALAPEYFFVISDSGAFYAHANFAVVFASLETAQEAARQPGSVNDLVLRLADDADRDALAAEIGSAFAARAPEYGATVTFTEDDTVYDLTFRDIEGDQDTYTVFAVLIVAGAVFAAFNLTTRMVDTQRREIGIAMALGVPALRIAVRPLLVGAQIAVLGVAFGVLAGQLIGLGMASLLESLNPLPVWETPFQVGLFAGVAAIGFAAPFLATVYPVARAVAMTPVRALSTGYLASRGGGLAPVIRRLRVPGGTFAQMPFRGVVRAPQRTLLTALGVGAAMAVLVGLLGALDSFRATVDRAGVEIEGDTPGRIVVDLEGMQPVDGEVVAAVGSAVSTGLAEPVIEVGATLINGSGEQVDLTLQVRDLASDLWRPTLSHVLDPADGPAVVIAEKAAADLDLEPGEQVTLRHPVRTGPASFTLVETELTVGATHPHPMRFVAYLDAAHADLLALEGAANQLQLVPASGSTIDSVKRELFAVPGIAAIEPATALVDTFNDVFDLFTSVLQFVAAIMLLLVGLIAFNSVVINVEERRREHAPMVAFGVPVRTVLHMAIVESVILGVIASAIGLALGWIVVDWLVDTRIASTVPDIGMVKTLSVRSMAIAAGLGIAAVALAPLFAIRRLRRMDIASTLRVLE